MELWEIFSFIGLSILKLLATPTTMIVAGYSIFQTLIVTAVGACTGVTIFFFFGRTIFAFLERKFSKNKKSLFNKGNRRIVSVKSRFGKPGVALFMGILSVPIGSLVFSALYGQKSANIVYLYGSAVVWTFALTFGTVLVKALFA